MKWDVTTPPTGRLVDFSTLKSHLGVDTDDDRDYILSTLDEATAAAEDFLACSLLTQTITAVYYAAEAYGPLLNPFGNTTSSTPGPFVPGISVVYPPRAYDLKLPRGPVQSITSVTDGRNHAITNFSLERVGNADMLHVPGGFNYPLTVVYVAGYGTADDVPGGIKRGVMMHVGTLFKYRESVGDKATTVIPHGLQDFYRLRSRNTGIG
jgi:hypothetical protein